MSLPLNHTRPLEGCSRRERTLATVLLPLPDSPTSAITSRGCKLNDTSLRARKRRALNPLATEKYLYRCSTRRIGSSVADPATLTSRPRGANDRQRWRWRTPAAALGSWCDIEPAPRRSEDEIDNLPADATCRAATRRYPSTAGAGRATAETSSSN